MSTVNFSKLTAQLKSELTKRFDSHVQFDVPMATLMAYEVGGPADAVIFPQTEADLEFVRMFSAKHSIPVTIVGSGTNLLVLDDGIEGITIYLKDAFSEIRLIQETKDSVLIHSGAGVLKSNLLNWAVDRGFTGLEFSAGVPGTIGGGIFMNAGTKYGCYADILRELRIFDFDSGPFQISSKDAVFQYRHQNLVTSRRLVLWVTFELKFGDQAAMRTEVERIIEERKSKQPLHRPSCGSTFKNPPGQSAGRLVEKAGLKGLRVGGAEISEKHANFILNHGTATAQDILDLITIAKNTVRDQFGVELECEVITLGGRNRKH